MRTSVPATAPIIAPVIAPVIAPPPHRGARARRGSGASRGFTLIELLIAISLMAVLAILAWRGLDSVLRSRERIVEASQNLRALATGFSQLEEDLRRTWPVRLLGLAVPPISFAQEIADGPPTLRLLREMPPDSGTAQIQRVSYRLREGTLERGFSAWTMPAPQGGGQAADAPMTWQPLVTEVTGLQIRAWISGQGWVAASGLQALPLAQQTANPVTGLEVLLERRNGERVLRVLAVKD